jgi:hypothetical protein
LETKTKNEKEFEMFNPTQLRNGIISGLAGGIVFGAMMGVMGMLPMIGKMVGQPFAIVGFGVHMVISALIGSGFSIIFDRLITGPKNGAGFGIGYGVIWWLLGPLTLMPLMMGMGFGVNWTAAAAIKMLPSLMGHAIYGVISGIFYGVLKIRSHRLAEA